MAGVAANFGHHIIQRVQPVILLVFCRQFIRGPLHLAHHGQRVLAGCPLAHREIAGNRGAFRRVEEAPCHVTPNEMANVNRQQQNNPRQHRIARPDHQRHKTTENHIAHPAKTTVEDATGQVVPVFFAGVGQGMRHMVWQDQETFDQGCNQHHRHREGNIGNQVAHRAAHHDQAKERNHRGDGGRKHRRGHPAGGIFCGLNRRFAQFPRPEIGVFANHNGVIHHDPQRDDQREQRNHVDGDPSHIHHRNRRQHRSRNPRRNPERRAGIQEQKQQQNHQPQPHQPVFQQDVQAAGNHFRARADQVDPDLGRQGQQHLFRDLFHLALNFNRITPGRAVNPHRDCRIIANVIGTVTVHTRHQHPRDIAHCQGRSISIAAQHNRRDLVGAAFGDPRAHPCIGTRHITRRIGGGFFGNRAGNFLHGHIVTDQRFRGDLDHSFRRCHPANGGARYPAIKQAGDKFIGKAPQLVHRHRAGDHHIGHAIAPRAAPHVRIIRLIGQGGYRIHRRLHFVGCAGHVPARLEFQGHNPHTFARCAV